LSDLSRFTISIEKATSASIGHYQEDSLGLVGAGWYGE